jgi:hypothetical protein
MIRFKHCTLRIEARRVAHPLPALRQGPVAALHAAQAGLNGDQHTVDGAVSTPPMRSWNRTADAVWW